MIYREVLQELSYQQIRELLKENFGEENARYHTLDEIPLERLITKIPKSICPSCGKEFIPNIEGGKELEGKWFCLDCFWNDDEVTLAISGTETTIQ